MVGCKGVKGMNRGIGMLRTKGECWGATWAPGSHIVNMEGREDEDEMGT